MAVKSQWLSEEVWAEAKIPRWKLQLLRVLFPRRPAVVIRGRTYLLRYPK
jgi:hypothetical protein